MELDFIPDLPSGPLDVYRRGASFSWKNLKLALEGGDIGLLKLKYKVWKTAEEDPLFAHSPTTPSAEEQKRITQLQVNRLNEYNFLPPDIKRASYKTKTRMVMTVNEAVQCLNPNVSVKMAIGIHLFTNALLSLGTERHLKLYEKVFNREILSCLALTEVAHGSDARLTRTTATYDPQRKEFVIHTPDFEAAKCWVGNLGRTCTHALLFAQLVMPDGTNHGLHGFIVPVRNPSTLETYAGLIIGDMGEKVGLNGIDNGFIMFNHYRIPRENLLNRTADVTEAGVYESCFSDPGRMLGAALENLSAGRLGIMQESCHSLSAAVSIAIRYAATRKQFGTKDKEIPLLDYELHQWRLFGYVAAAVVFKIYIAKFTDIYLETVEKSNSGAKIDNLSDIVSEIHAIVSSSKPLVTWVAMDAIQESREACGGHGYLKCANLGELRNNHDPCVTYEGDNNVLSQQAGNWLLRQLEAVDSGQDVYSPLGTASFLGRIGDILSGTAPAFVGSSHFIISTYQWLLCWLLKETNKKYQEELSKGLSKFEAKAKSQVFRWKVLTRVYAEYVAMIFYQKGLDKADAKLKPVLERMLLMFGLTSLDKHLVYLYQGGYAQGEELVRNVREAILNLCGELKSDIVSVVDALAPTDFVLNSVLGKCDGNLYQNLQRELFHTPGAFERATWWQDVVKSPRSKL